MASGGERALEERLARALNDEGVQHWVPAWVGQVVAKAGLALYDPATHVAVRRAEWEQVRNHRCGLPDNINEALNSGDGTYRP